MDEEFVPKRRVKLSRIIIILVIILGAVGVIWYINNEKDKVYTDYSVGRKYEIDSSVTASYVKYAEGVAGYSTDGVSYINNGHIVWNCAISAGKPIVDVCGDYIVVAAQKENQIYLFDVSGTKWELQATYPIYGIEVSKQGVVAATVDDGSVNYVELIAKDGTKIATGRTVLSGDGYPIDISISTDGTKLAASYLAVSNGSTQSKVVFYNYSEVGQNKTDRIVGGFNQYTDSVVPKVEFISNNVAVAFGDNMFTVYSIKQTPKVIYEEKFSNKIKSIFYNSGNIGMVFENDDSSYPYAIKVYDANGKKILSYKTNFQYNDIVFSGDNILMYNSNECELISISGKERFKGSFERNIIKMVPISESKYAIVSDTAIEEIVLK